MPQTTTDHTAEAGMTTLRAALEFYASPANWSGDAAPWPLTFDPPNYQGNGYDVACAALAASPAPSAPAAGVPEELVDRVALAIFSTITEITLTEEQWQIGKDESPDDAENFRRAARSAIAAMGTLAAAGAAAPAEGGTEFDPGPAPPFDPELEAAARRLAAFKMCSSNPSGSHLPDELWQQCVPEALAALATSTPAGAAGDPVGFPYREGARNVEAKDKAAVANKVQFELKKYDTCVLVGDEYGYGICLNRSEWMAVIASLRAAALATRPAPPAPAASAGVPFKAELDRYAQDCALVHRKLTDDEMWLLEGFASALAPAAPSGLPGREEIARRVAASLSDQHVKMGQPWHWTSEQALELAYAAILAAWPVAEGVAGWQMVPLRFCIAVFEFLEDWKKGDFVLSELARLDAQCIENAREEWAKAVPPTPPTDVDPAARPGASAIKGGEG